MLSKKAQNLLKLLAPMSNVTDEAASEEEDEDKENEKSRHEKSGSFFSKIIIKNFRPVSFFFSDNTVNSGLSDSSIYMPGKQSTPKVCSSQYQVYFIYIFLCLYSKNHLLSSYNYNQCCRKKCWVWRMFLLNCAFLMINFTTLQSRNSYNSDILLQIIVVKAMLKMNHSFMFI